MDQPSPEYALLRDLWCFADIVLAELAKTGDRPALLAALRLHQASLDRRAVAILGVTKEALKVTA